MHQSISSANIASLARSPRPGPEGLLPCRRGDHLHQRPQAQARGRVSYLALFSCFDATIFIVRCSFAVSLSLATAAAWSTPLTSWTDQRSTAAGSGWSRRAAEGAAEGPGPTAGPGIDFLFAVFSVTRRFVFKSPTRGVKIAKKSPALIENCVKSPKFWVKIAI